MIWTGHGHSRPYIAKQEARKRGDLKHEGKTERGQQRDIGTIPRPVREDERRYDNIQMHIVFCLFGTFGTVVVRDFIG